MGDRFQQKRNKHNATLRERNECNRKCLKRNRNLYNTTHHLMSTLVIFPRSTTVALKTAVVSLPLVLWFRDTFFGVCRVQGTSMEPTLLPGDLVLVRKCDSGVLVDGILRLVGMDNHGDGETERARVRVYEHGQGTTQYVPVSRFYECPPTALSGHVVVYKDPEAGFPVQWAVKRVVGLGGQWLRQPMGTGNSPWSSSARRLQSLPPHTLFVQGDNTSNSRDSRHYGPISKNLLIGIAEYVVWPPTRWQRIKRVPVVDEKGKPRAFWP